MAASTGAGPFRHLAPNQTTQIRIVDRDGLRDVLLYETSRLLEAPNWTPNGRGLIVNGGGLLYRLSIEGGAGPEGMPVTGIVNANNDHVMSRDGSTIYLTAGAAVYSVAVAGDTPKRLSPEGSTAFYLHGISPDGSMLACTTCSTAAVDRSWGIALLPAIGGKPTWLRVGARPMDGPEWSHDGAFLWYNAEAERCAPGHAQLFRMRVDGTCSTAMTFGTRVAWFPHPDPTGESVAYLSYPPGTLGHPADRDVRIEVIPAQGGESRILATCHGGQGTLNVNSWSPDGMHLAYIAYPRYEAGAGR